MSVTIRQVAQYAGVSLKTVSRVINQENNVSEITQNKVLKAIEELGFVPNNIARNLAKGLSHSIGLVLGWELYSTYASTLVFNIQSACEKNSYNLVLFSKSPSNISDAINAYLGRKIDGIILDTIPSMDSESLNRMSQKHIPNIVIHPGRDLLDDSFSTVTVNDVEGFTKAINYLLDLGHESIGFIHSGTSYQSQMRKRGYEIALQDAGIPYSQSNIFYWKEDNEFEAGHKGAIKLISEIPDLTAISCQTDEMAIGAMSAIWQMGKKIPEEISVIGYDDIRFSKMMTPPLTTMHQPIEEIARFSVNQLLSQIKDPNCKKINKVFDVSLEIRSTCAKPN